MNSLLIEDLTRKEIAALLSTGYDTVLLMLGSIEQHGPHLPVGTDTILGYKWGEEIVGRLGNTLLAPVIRPGISGHHLGFPGTITVDEDTFRKVVFQSCDSLLQTGFKNIVILCSHGGNWPLIHESAVELRALARSRGKILILAEENIKYIENEIYGFLADKGFTAAMAGVHAGLRETAYMLYLTPDLVRRKDIEAGCVDKTVLGKLKKGAVLKDISPSGVLGDPRRATSELGRELNEITVKLYVQAIRERLRGNSGEHVTSGTEK